MGETEAQKRARLKYEAEHTTQIKLKLNRNTDADILEKLSSVPSKQGYIKELIRADIADEWIPCSERLPDKPGFYLITAMWNGELIGAADDYFSYGWDDFGDCVVAWKEFPKLYKGGE